LRAAGAARFWLKTALYRLAPTEFGYYRRLRKLRDRHFVLARDQHPTRKKHHTGSGWQEAAEEGVIRRDYSSYEEYVDHQKAKLDEILKMQGTPGNPGFINWQVAGARVHFYRRFRRLPARLPPSAAVLCAGARVGTEVEVLRDLGFRNAYGIDLNPGPGNRLVRPGDFNALAEPDASIDLLYTNCVDHAFELDAFFAEHARVVKPGGYALYDLAGGGPGGAFEAIAWASQGVVLGAMLRHFDQVVEAGSEPGGTWFLVRRGG
jgi:SAM-dependent methyltransferase